MKLLRKYAYLVPQVQLVATFLLSFVDFSASNSDSMILLSKIGNILGYSILTNIIYVLYFFRRSFCDFTKFCIIALCAMSLVNVLGSYIAYDTYSKAYDISISCICILSWIWYSLTKKICGANSSDLKK